MQRQIQKRCRAKWLPLSHGYCCGRVKTGGERPPRAPAAGKQSFVAQSVPALAVPSQEPPAGSGRVLGAFGGKATLLVAGSLQLRGCPAKRSSGGRITLMHPVGPLVGGLGKPENLHHHWQ